MKNIKAVTSKDNPLIKLVCALQGSAKARKTEGLFVLEGLRICSDAMENSIKFDKLIISSSAEERYKTELSAFFENSDEINKIPDSLFTKISDTQSPQGIIAVVKIPKLNNEISKNGRYIALERLNDPSNLGAVSRTAEALGVSGIIMSGDSVDPYSPKSLRASMGTLLRMPLFILPDFVGDLKKSGLKLFACVVDKNAKPITEVDFTDGTVLAIGNEANGLSEEFKNASDECITIKMCGKAESLNAATAAAISIWEMMK